jgi:hypothetical protein
MKDFCGKHGCYQVEKDENIEYVKVYLNSVKVLAEEENDFVNFGADTRPVPDVIFELIKEEDTDCMLTTGMEVPAFCADGVNEFVAAIIKDSDKISESDGLYDQVEQLLNQDNAPWGAQ